MRYWMAKAKCTVVKHFFVTAETEEAAREKFDVLDSIECVADDEMTDWELLSIQENK